VGVVGEHCPKPTLWGVGSLWGDPSSVSFVCLFNYRHFLPETRVFPSSLINFLLLRLKTPSSLSEQQLGPFQLPSIPSSQNDFLFIINGPKPVPGWSPFVRELTVAFHAREQCLLLERMEINCDH
jgi:hypothetical protein